MTYPEKKFTRMLMPGSAVSGSRCGGCSKVVAYSAAPRMLEIAEQAHVCRAPRPGKTYAATAVVAGD